MATDAQARRFTTDGVRKNRPALTIVDAIGGARLDGARTLQLLNLLHERIERLESLLDSYDVNWRTGACMNWRER